jgi:hypothetical protein
MAITRDLAELLSQQMATGTGSARVAFGGKSSAFAWCSDKVNGLISYVDTGVSQSMTFKATKINRSADVEPWTTGEKTDTAVITVEDVALAVYPGAVEIKSRDILDTANLGSAVSTALYGQALRAMDYALITDLLGTVPTVDAAATLATIAEAQAGLMANGFSPTLCAVSPTLYASLAGGSLLVGANDPQNEAQSVLGSRLVVSSALTGAQAIVLDPSAVVAVEHESSPLVLMQTQARLNVVDLVVEVVGGWVIANSDGVSTVYVG